MDKTNPERTEAYQQGLSAGEWCLAVALNPFDESDAQHEQWRAGWHAGAVTVASANAYAEQQIRAAKERAQWERDLATGARDASNWRRA